MPSPAALITLTASANATAPLAGTTSRSTTSGVATFADLTFSNETMGLTLLASASGFATVSSAPFEIFDLIAPTVTDFTAVATAPFSISTEWTSPGDDGFLGDNIQGSYSLCYSSSPITATSPATCRESADGGLLPPEPVGFPQGAIVTGLSSGTQYFLRLRVADAPGNTFVAFAQNVTHPCAAGTTGPQCDQCLPGYVLDGSGLCVDLCTAQNPCITPPPSFCSAQTATHYPSPGACTPASSSPFFSCDYQPMTTNCAATGRSCLNGACVP